MEKIKVLSYDFDEDGCDNFAQSAKRLNQKINLWIAKQEREIRLTKPPVISAPREDLLMIILCYEEVGSSKKKPKKPAPVKSNK